MVNFHFQEEVVGGSGKFPFSGGSGRRKEGGSGVSFSS